MFQTVMSNYLKKITVLVDILLINLAFIVSFWIRFAGELPPANFGPYKLLWPAITLLGIFGFWLVGLYEYKNRKGLELLWVSSLGSVLTVILAMGLLYLAGIHSFPRSVLVISFIALTLLVFVWRAVLLSFRQSKRVLIIGDNGESDEIVSKFESFIGEHAYQIVDVLTSKDLPLSPEKMANVDVICISASVPHDKREKLMMDALQWNVELYVIPRLYEIMLKGAEASRLDDSMYFKLKPLGLDPVQMFIKRVFDMFLSISGLLLIVWWLFPIIAIAIRLDSPGPVFYSQVRVGKDGKTFKVHKFRTMVNDAEKYSGPVIATANDPRITKVGAFLRKTRLDELPQLWNVLKGEMSFVGPRPERPNFVKDFIKQNPVYQYRLKVKPGITGLAQVEGNYSSEFKDKLRFDLMYIRNYSLLLDIQIILKTIHVVSNPDKASGRLTKSLAEGELLKQVAVGKDNETL